MTAIDCNKKAAVEAAFLLQCGIVRQCELIPYAVVFHDWIELVAGTE
jgi:hypothetical protein